MADNINDEELKYVKALQQKTRNLRKVARVEQAELEYFSALTNLNTSVLKEKKQLDELTKKQRITNQQFSLVNSALSNTRDEITKSIVNYRMNNVRMAQSIQVKQQEIAIMQEKIKIATSEISAAKSNIEKLEQRKELLTQHSIEIGKELDITKKTQQALESEIDARKLVADKLRAEVTSTSALKDAVDTRIQALTNSNQSLQKEHDQTLSTLGVLNARVASGEKLTDAENAERTRLQSVMMTIISSMQDNNKALNEERLKRFDLTGILTTQQSELQKVNGAISGLTTEFFEATDKVTNLTDRLNKTARNINELNSGIVDLEKSIETTESGLTELGKEAVNQANELKLLKLNNLASKLKGFSDILTAVTKPINDMVKSVRDTQQRLGVVASQAATIGVENLKASAKSFAGALVGGGPGVTAEQIAQSQADFREEFGGIITSEAATTLAQQAVSMGVTTKQLAQARRAFMAQTGNDGIRAAGQVDKFITEFKKKGLTAQDAMEAISQNSELLARNGTRFATALTRAAADAKKIGVDLGKVDQIADSIIGDFESYLEKQAELGAMGFGFDTSKLAELAETGDTAAFGNELRSQLAATGKDLNKLRRSERQALEGAFGIPISDILKLAGPTPEGTAGGEKTVDIQVQTNDNITKVFNATEAGVKVAELTNTLLDKANGILGLIATNTAVGGLGSALGARGALKAAAGAIPKVGATLAGSAGAAGAAAIGTTVVGGGLAGLAIGDMFNKSVAEGGSGTFFGDFLNYNVGKSREEKEADRKNDEFARSKGFNSMAEMLASRRSTRGDDVISQPGYGKRSLVTPSGVIALNNRDNIIAYADDMVGTKRLPLGTISKAVAAYREGGKDGLKSNLMSTGMGLANKNIPGFSKYMPQATDLYGTYKQSGTAGLKATALEKGLGFLGNRIPQLSGSIDAYKQGGVTGAKSSLLNTGLGLLGKKFPSLSGSIDVFKEGGFGGLKSNLMNKGTELLTKKVPGFSGAMSAFSAYKKGGVKGVLGSLAQGGIGKGIGAAIGTAIPIPFIGTAIGSLVGSKLGKLAGGLFGKKKQQSATISPEMMQTETIPDLSTFLGSQARQEETKQAPKQQVTVDTSGIENKLNNFINALQSIQIHMDGTKVGNVLVNTSDAAMSTAVFRAQSR